MTTSPLKYIRSHVVARSPLIKTLDWSVKTLGRECNSTGRNMTDIIPDARERTNFILLQYYILNFVVTPRNFIIAKLSIRKPGSSSVLILSYYY